MSWCLLTCSNYVIHVVHSFWVLPVRRAGNYSCWLSCVLACDKITACDELIGDEMTLWRLDWQPIRMTFAETTISVHPDWYQKLLSVQTENQLNQLNTWHLLLYFAAALDRFTKYLTTILRLSYDNAKVTIDLRRTSDLQNILRRTQGFS